MPKAFGHAVMEDMMMLNEVGRGPVRRRLAIGFLLLVTP